MKLVIGGAYQGKRDAACRMFGLRESELIDGRDCPLDVIKTCKAICNFHTYILRCMESGQSLEDFASELAKENPDLVIISDEIGYGVVPIEKELRAWREKTGRICCQLAALSDTVVRVIAGVPCVIKDTSGGGQR